MRRCTAPGLAAVIVFYAEASSRATVASVRGSTGWSRIARCSMTPRSKASRSAAGIVIVGGIAADSKVQLMA